jgi:hypothetical protein
MRKLLLALMLFFSVSAVNAQKVDSIFFNLYTDSLKKGFYNYISVDGKLSDGTWTPLDSTYIVLSSNAGWFRGNDLFLDSSWTEETVKVKAILRSNPRIHKTITIWIRKRGFDEPLKTDEEILRDLQNEKKKKRSR